MDTIISRMMQLLGAILVLGMVFSGVEAAQLHDWQGAIAFLVFGTVSAAIFTTIWTIATYHIVALIGKNRKRSDITEKSIIGSSVGVLALFTARRLRHRRHHRHQWHGQHLCALVLRPRRPDHRCAVLDLVLFGIRLHRENEVVQEDPHDTDYICRLTFRCAISL